MVLEEVQNKWPFDTLVALSDGDPRAQAVRYQTIIFLVVIDQLQQIIFQFTKILYEQRAQKLRFIVFGLVLKLQQDDEAVDYVLLHGLVKHWILLFADFLQFSTMVYAPATLFCAVMVPAVALQLTHQLNWQLDHFDFVVEFAMFASIETWLA